MTSDLPISIMEYERICSVVLSVLNDLQTKLSMDCMYIALVSQAILRFHHGIDASIVSGQAEICLGVDSKGVARILSFGKTDPAHRNQSAFHAWIRIDKWLLDFSAPIYREAIKEVRQNFDDDFNVPRKMMAIKIDTLGQFKTHNQLTKFVEDDNERFDAISSYKDDLRFNYSLNECLAWYKRGPKECSSVHVCKIAFGKSSEIRLLNLRLEGAW